MKNILSSRAIQIIFSFSIFAGLVILLQFSPLNTIHGGSDAPIIVAIFGTISLVLSYALHLKWLTLTTTLGYIVALLVGVIFNTAGVDAGGAATNNLWQIWIVSYWIFIGLGIVAEIFIWYKKKKRNK